MLKYYRTAFVGSDINEVKKLQRHIKNMAIAAVLNAADLSLCEELFMREDVDVIIVSHFPPAPMAFLLQAMQSKKPVFFEDCYFNVVEIDSLKKLLDQEMIPALHIGSIHRYDPHLAYLQQSIQKNTLGKLYLVKIIKHYINNTVDQALLSALDCVRFVTDQAIKETFVMHGNRTHVISLRLENDVLVVIDLNQQMDYGYDDRIEVLGENGSLAMDNLTAASTMQYNADGNMSEIPLITAAERYTEARQLQLSAYFEALDKNSLQGWLSLHDVLGRLKLVQTIMYTQTSQILENENFSTVVGL